LRAQIGHTRAHARRRQRRRASPLGARAQTRRLLVGMATHRRLRPGPPESARGEVPVRESAFRGHHGEGNGADPCALRRVKGVSFPVPRAKRGPSRFKDGSPTRAADGRGAQPRTGTDQQTTTPLAVSSRGKGGGEDDSDVSRGRKPRVHDTRAPPLSLARGRGRETVVRSDRRSESVCLRACLPAWSQPGVARPWRVGERSDRGERERERARQPAGDRRGRGFNEPCWMR
jgi:hypothetical protein